MQLSPVAKSVTQIAVASIILILLRGELIFHNISQIGRLLS